MIFDTKIELNDFKVYGVDLDTVNYEFKVTVEGAYWFKENTLKPVVMEKGGFIAVTLYDSFEARYFTPQDKLWRTLDYSSIEPLDEVNEKVYENGILKLAGLEKKVGIGLSI